MKRVLIGVFTAALIPALLVIGFLAGVFYRPALTEADMERLYREAARAMAEWDADTGDVVIYEHAPGLRYERVANGHIDLARGDERPDAMLQYGRTHDCAPDSLCAELHDADLSEYDGYAAMMQRRLAACMARPEHGPFHRDERAGAPVFYVELSKDCLAECFPGAAYDRGYIGVLFYKDRTFQRCELKLYGDGWCDEYLFGDIEFEMRFM